MKQNEVAPRKIGPKMEPIAQRWREKAKQKSNMEASSIDDDDRITMSKYHALMPPSFRRRSWPRSVVNSRVSAVLKCFNHCLVNIARKAARTEVTKLAMQMTRTCANARGWLVHGDCGRGGISFPSAVTLSSRMRAQREAVVPSPRASRS